MTIEKLAEVTRDEFKSTRDEFALVRKEMATKESVRLLHEEMNSEFSAVRKEMQENTRAILAAIESVEYVKLRMRIDSLETRMDKVERLGKR